MAADGLIPIDGSVWIVSNLDFPEIFEQLNAARVDFALLEFAFLILFSEGVFMVKECAGTTDRICS